MPAFYQIAVTSVGADKVFHLVRDAFDPAVLLTAIGARFTSYIDESFRTQGRGSWRPLSFLTLLFRRGGEAALQNTGRYKQSFVTETDNRTFVEVGTNLMTPNGKFSLGKIHELGTKPFIIRPVNKKVLAAQATGSAGGRMAGWIFFGKEVHHPGIPARPVLPTQVVADKLAQETIDAVLSRTIAAAGG